jgi:hypothetical protein
MGFLSKLFGGDAAVPPGKAEAALPQAEERSKTPNPEPQAAVAEAAVAEPAQAATPLTAAPPAPASKQKLEPVLHEPLTKVATGTAPKPSAQHKPPEPALPTFAAAPVVAVPVETAPAAPVPVAPGSVAAAPLAAAPLTAAPVAATAPPAPAPVAAAPVAVPAVTVAVPRASAERPRRALEDSVVTSAPKLPETPGRAGGLPRPTAGKGSTISKNPAPPAPSAPRAQAAGLDTGGAAASRSRKDRNKSPGFYSSVSPLNGSPPVSAGAPTATTLMKATITGVAPPPERLQEPAKLDPSKVETGKIDPAQAEVAKVEAAKVEAVKVEAVKVEAVKVEAEARLETKPEANAPVSAQPGTNRQVDPAVVPLEPRGNAASTPLPLSPAPKPSAAPPILDPSDKEKEETAPGLGQSRSRHEPLIPLDLPPKDLEFLVEFIMDLAIGPTASTWLAPLRAAVRRLEEAALRGQRSLLEKALTGLALELDGSGEIGDERRRRILHHFVGVEMALPRPLGGAGPMAKSRSPIH